MDGKDAIISDIITSAEAKAAAIVADAAAERDAHLEKCRSELSRKEKEALTRAEEEARLSVERRMTLAALDGRKLLLEAKQSVIDKVYEAAITKTLNMTDNMYREFIGELIKRYADDGDEVMVSERDAKRLNYDWIAALSEKLGKDLTLSRRFHGGKGGIILVGFKCDKNLTLDAIAAQLRPSTEGEIAAKLFGGEKQGAKNKK